MKKYWTKKKKKNCFLLVIVAFIIPLIINEAYKIGGYVTVWDGSDMLAFYGNILTAAAAIIGVYYTLDYSKFKQMDFEKLRVKPYLQITHFGELSDVQNIYKVNQNEIYVYKNLNNEHPESGFGILPNELYKISKSNKLADINSITKNSVFLNFYIRNIGTDSAINIKIIFDNHTIVNGLSLSKNEAKLLRILIVFKDELKMASEIALEDMKLSIDYENIYGNQKYEQYGCIKKFTYKKNTREYSYSEDMDGDVSLFSKQIEINN